MGSYVGSPNASRPQINRQKNNREEPKQKCRLGTAGGGGVAGGVGLQLVCGRPTLALSSDLVPQTLICSVCVEDS